ncbi:unnamed protein product [Didymodactylos carnosus]|uniref:G-protein coupled receptors family 1 profile domain-containing protein n=1 Tax=Didymodactylos carnosus TaxID=1234261 RepID=A0A815Y935_9BILA|nr:unnamed protein product [Didymodactylos carnosus]CAF1567142.1 unnamed protein product [Didymodactylos carnosus]CAF4283957.1 unnamed protein product [Didymodactylos carnosus]CAF4429511.1 unnamed protein product [Didymodactylos carnosus]
MVILCTFIGGIFFFIGTFGNILCIVVFLRRKFRSRIITPYFIALLLADSIYLGLRLIKLFYHQQHSFYRYLHQSCSQNFLIDLFNMVTQKFHVLFIPFVHFETYVRFSIIVLGFLSMQRCLHLQRLKVAKKNYWSYSFILLSFIIAYAFEFFGLTLFCSRENNRQLSYSWFLYTVQNLTNYTNLLTISMKNHPSDYQCTQQHIQRIISNVIPNCTNEQLIEILGRVVLEHTFSVAVYIARSLYI